MALQIRRGTDAQRQTQRFEAGELIYTTDYKDLFVGDGAGGTLGGVRIAPVKSVNGVEGSLATGAVTLTSDNIAEGATNKYYSSTQARIDAGAALVGGNAGNVGISFSYQSNTNTITANVSSGGYDLPIAAPTDLGGVKISQGGLQIDGAGLLSITTPVSAGTTGQLTYYTGTNSVGTAGSKLSWTPSNNFYADGQLTVVGTVDAHRINITASADNGFFLATQSDGGSSTEVFALRSSHNSSDATTMRLFRSRGTVASPTDIQANDDIFKLQFVGLTNGGGNGGISAQIRGTAIGTIANDIVPGKLVLSSANASGVLVDSMVVGATDVTFATRAKFPDGTASAPGITFTTDGSTDTGIFHPGDGIMAISTDGVERVRVDNGGMRVSGFMKVAQVSGTLPAPAEAGMIVLDGTTFKGYNGSAWVNLN